MLTGNFSFYYYLLPKDEFGFLPPRYQMAILVGTLFTILFLIGLIFIGLGEE